MNRLQSELHRLYLPRPADAPGVDAPGADTASTELFDAHGRTRALVLELARPAEWEPLARAWRGVQAELELPAPAVAVSGTDGLQLWFSLAQPVPVREAQAFLEALRLRFLPELPPARVRLMPTEASAGPAAHAAPVPAEQAEEGRWSAFVTPDLAALFTETPWLDLPPGVDGQADLLCRLKSIGPAAFDQARARLAPAAPAAEPAVDATRTPEAGARFAQAVHETTQARPAGAGASASALEPREFLLRVMRDETVALALRIEAAKALLRHRDDVEGLRDAAAHRRGD